MDAIKQRQAHLKRFDRIVDNEEIIILDGYAPEVFGVDIPEPLMREVYLMKPDLSPMVREVCFWCGYPRTSDEGSVSDEARFESNGTRGLFITIVVEVVLLLTDGLVVVISAMLVQVLGV